MTDIEHTEKTKSNISTEDRANVLIQALPYIQKWAGKTIVVKYGGNAMLSEELKEAVMSDIVLLQLVGINTVLVHGGGPEINAMLDKIGKESKFINGMRYTDEETMDIVQMVLAGKVNKSLVQHLMHHSGKALGLCGLDGRMLMAEKLMKKDDLGFVGELKGTKLLLRGNHDYWWQSVTKVREALPQGMYVLQNDAFRFGDLFIAGTRGWTVPESAHFKESADRKLYERERIRLDLSLSAVPQGAPLIGLLHYPPFSEAGKPSAYADRFAQAGASDVVYGHLHGASHRTAFLGASAGVNYHLVSADYLDFVTRLIL